VNYEELKADRVQDLIRDLAAVSRQSVDVAGDVLCRTLDAYEGYDDTAPCPTCGMPGPGDPVWFEDAAAPDDGTEEG
jgi:hypothetical protein